MDAGGTPSAELRCAMLLHDLNNLLTGAVLALSDEGWGPEDREQRMAIARTCVERATAQIAVALDRSLGDGLADGACIEQSVRVVAFTAPSVRVELGEVPPLPALPIPRVDLERALVNVVRNALIAAGSGGQVTVRVEHQDTHVRIVVEDDGPGLEAPSRRPGRGLGLLSTREMLVPHGGTLDLTPVRTGGTRAVLTLPVEVP